MILKSLSIKNFKAVVSLKLTELENVNYIVGENGSGKSSILDLLRLTSMLHDRSIVDATWWGSAAHIVRTQNRVDIEYSEAGYETYLALESPEDNARISLNRRSRTRRSSSATLNSEQAILYRSFFLDSAASSDEYQTEFKVNPQFDKEMTNGLTSAETIKNFLNKYYCRPHEEVDLLYKATGGNPTLMIKIVEKGDRRNILRDESLKSLARGFHHLFELYFPLREHIKKALDMARNTGGIALILLEEPETHLHPKLQKLVPIIIDELANEFGRDNLQFFVSTHSPFIISEGVRLDHQRVYLTREGSLIDLQGAAVGESPGYQGDRCLSVVAEMLGAGLSDMQPRPTTFTQVKVVYCEGRSDKITDAEIYSVIFEGVGFTFVSCGSAKEAINAYYSARSALPFVFGEGARAYVLIDRSCSGENAIAIGPGEFLEPTSIDKPLFSADERKRFLDSSDSQSYRMLSRKEIENYLFDPVVVNLLNDKDKDQVVGITSELDYVEGEIKDHVRTTPSIKRKLAALIATHKEKETKALFDELSACLGTHE